MLKNTSPERKRSWIWSCWCESDVAASYAERGNNLRIDTSEVGEIDFIVLNLELKKIFVCECKYNRTRYEGVGFQAEHSKFSDDYETKLKRKLKWISENKKLVEEHFQVIYPSHKIDVTDFTIEPLFILNTPTFYMLNGNIIAIALKNLTSYLKGELRQELPIVISVAGKDITVNVTHPFFSLKQIESAARNILKN